jgi:lipopolysaccharide biosynthesis protein
MRRLWSSVSRTRDITISWCLWCLAVLHFRRHYIRATWHGAVPLAEALRAAVLVHYDRQGRMLRYLQYLVRALEQAGFAVIIVSNSPRIDQTTLKQVLPHCAAVIHRRNVGLDFGAWRDALSLIENITGLKCLVIGNDSIFGPLQDIAAVLKRCNFAVADVWGMTDSYDVRYHLQSYFLIFGSTALASDCFRDFWKRLRYVGHKRSVVILYEVGLSQALLKSGLRLKALFPYSQLVDAVLGQAIAGRADHHKLGADFFDMLLQRVNSGIPLNPTHYFWEYLITSVGFPFLKRELIEKNPVAIPFVINWRNALRQSTNFPVDLIDEYLQTAARNRIF